MKQLEQFLTEKEETGAPKPTHPGAGSDDEMYVKLMIEYKSKRRGDREEAGKILDKARKLIEDGDVSDEAIMAVAYL